MKKPRTSHEGNGAELTKGEYHMELTIANVGIRQDEQGRYCLNDLHRSAGGESKHQPANWLRNQQTQELIEELNQIPQIRGIETKQGLGTFVCKELVYSYAMWISPAFNLKVIRAYDSMSAPQIPQTLPEALRLAADLAEKNALLAPKAAIADRIASADGWFSLRDAAKALKMAERKFIFWLEEHRWLYRDQKGKLRGRSEKVPRFINHKVMPIPVDGDDDRVALQPMVTAEGLTKQAQIFNTGVTV